MGGDSMPNGKLGSGITPMGALAVLFVGLRLTGVVDWPWWAVLLPL